MLVSYLNSAGNPVPPTLSVEMNDKVTASCFVHHSCPYIPPKFSWSHSGIVMLRSKRLTNWKWKIVSTLTFNLLFVDLNTPLNCTVHYRGGKKAESSTILTIWCEPSAGTEYHFSLWMGKSKSVKSVVECLTVAYLLIAEWEILPYPTNLPNQSVQTCWTFPCTV